MLLQITYPTPLQYTMCMYGIQVLRSMGTAFVLAPAAASAAPSTISRCELWCFPQKKLSSLLINNVGNHDCSIQGSVQDVVSPGHWLGQFIGITSKSEEWQFDASPKEVCMNSLHQCDFVTTKKVS